MITAALGFFFVILTLLAIQVRNGRDPALGPGPAVPAVSQPAGKGGAGQAGDEDRLPHLAGGAVSPAAGRAAQAVAARPSPAQLIAAIAVLLALAGLAAYTMFSGPTTVAVTRPGAGARQAGPARARGGEPESPEGNRGD